LTTWGGRKKSIARNALLFATLLYQIGSEKKPFEWLSNKKVQQRYSNAEFSNDVKTLPLPLLIIILSFWSVEFVDISALHSLKNLFFDRIIKLFDPRAPHSFNNNKQRQLSLEFLHSHSVEKRLISSTIWWKFMFEKVVKRWNVSKNITSVHVSKKGVNVAK
jgi:hypothetical protein